MTAFRLLLPVSLVFLCGCLAQVTFNPRVAKEEEIQGFNGPNTILRDSETEPQKKSPCYEDDHRFAPIISRDAWDEKKMKLYTIQPMHYIVVRDGGKRCRTHTECLASLSEVMQKADDPECRVADNFYIGGNGEVYEGRGWAAAPFWHLHGMRRRAVTVKFLGSYESEGPDDMVLRAFWRLAMTGMWGGMLSADYRVLSMGQVYNNSAIVGAALEKIFQESNVGIKEFNKLETWEIIPDKGLPIITRQEWGAKKPTKSLPKIESRAEYIIIYEGGERCFTPEECVSRVRAEQEQQLPIYGDVIDNFYIGDDGFVYEGRGFNTKPLWDIDVQNEQRNLFQPESVTVKFFGNFQSERPSERAVDAFKLLANGGFWASDNYKLHSLRDIFNNPQLLGDEFYKIARKWNAWAPKPDDHHAGESSKEDSFRGLVKRSDWEASDPTKEFGNVNHPVGYIIIKDDPENGSCLDSKECISLMKEIQKNQEGYGDLIDNFYVSGNGKVYEGRGWNTEPHFQAKYFNKSLITVNFLGNHKEHGASIASLAVFEILIRIGVKFGKIAPNYQFYSSRNVYDATDMLGDGLNDYFVNTKQWSKQLDALTEKERWDSEVLPIVLQGEWTGVSSANGTHHPFTEPVHYVVIGSTGDRCFTHEECGEIMKEGQKRNLTNARGFLDNFYIGDDGLAYEGRGWNFAPANYLDGFKSKFYYVTFFRQYGEVAPPSALSIAAFNRLMENGVKTQKLSPDFKIISIHQVFENEKAPEDILYKTIKTWDRWTSEFTAMPDGMPSGHDLFVSRTGWHGEEFANQIPIEGHPLGYVIVRNVGDQCSDLTTCTLTMQTIRKNKPVKYWDVADNFYVGDDGHIYEGRGWDHISMWGAKGIEHDFLSVGFLGSFESNPPSQKALLAFQTLQQIGIIMGKLTPSSKVISLGEILKEKIVVSEKLISVLRATDYWSDDVDLKYDKARLQSLYSPFILSTEWNLSKMPVRMSSKMSLPLKYIAISNGGAYCNTSDACAKRILKEHEGRHASSDEGVAENFYVGDDGNVYEGVGWDWDMKWAFDGWQKTTTVRFFGDYVNDLPSAKAIEAFNTVIIRDGIETGKLSPEYKIVPIPEGLEISISKKLKEEILTWKNAVGTIG